MSEETDYREKIEDRQKLRNNQHNNQQSPSEVDPIPQDVQPVVDDVL